MKRAVILIMVFSLLLPCVSLSQTESQETGAPSSTEETGQPDLPEVEDEIVVEDKPKSVKEWLNNQPRKKRGAIKGAVKGAAGGLLGAAILGKDPIAGALIGAAAGAATGYLIGRRKDKVFAARDAAVAEIDYDPSQGYVIQVQEVRFDPPNLQPGESADMYVRYLVVGPDPKEKIVVQAYTGIKYSGDYVSGNGPDKVVVRRGGGIVETTMAVTMPEEAPSGSYTVEAMFEEREGRIKDAGEGPLYVVAPEEASETAEAT